MTSKTYRNATMYIARGTRPGEWTVFDSAHGEDVYGAFGNFLYHTDA